MVRNAPLDSLPQVILPSMTYCICREKYGKGTYVLLTPYDMIWYNVWTMTIEQVHRSVFSCQQPIHQPGIYIQTWICSYCTWKVCARPLTYHKKSLRNAPEQSSQSYISAGIYHTWYRTYQDTRYATGSYITLLRGGQTANRRAVIIFLFFYLPISACARRSNWNWKPK